MALFFSLFNTVALVSLWCICNAQSYGDASFRRPTFQGLQQLTPVQQQVVVRPQQVGEFGFDPLGRLVPRLGLVQRIGLSKAQQGYLGKGMIQQGRPVVGLGQMQQGRPVVGLGQMQQGRPVVGLGQMQQGHLDSIHGPRPRVQSVVADCQESAVLIVVHRDLLGVGRLIQPSDITLGGCPPTGQDDIAQVLVFETELQGCGSVLTMTDDTLVYNFTLIYAPNKAGAHIMRVNDATISIECYYFRKYNVSSGALKPSWVSYRDSIPIENDLAFSLKLMESDWESERASNVYALGDLINIEASVTVANHVPLHVFVDSCVATSVPDVMAVPRYAFVENHGCFMDSKLTSSRSQFMSRTQQDKLQMQIDAFRFSQESSSMLYITCLLEATISSPTMEHKACSFNADGRWMAVDGEDYVCDCCDATCVPRKGRGLVNSAHNWHHEAFLGPITIQEKSQVVAEAQAISSNAEEHGGTGFSPEMMALAAIVSALGLISVAVLGAILCWR